MFQVLSKNITLRPEQIEELAEGIQKSIVSLTDIDEIIRRTEGDLRTAEALKSQADYSAYDFLNISYIKPSVLKC